MLDENYVSIILSLSDVVDTCRVIMNTSVDDAFHARVSKCFTRCGRTKHCMHEVSTHESSNVSRSEYESMFGREGVVKENKVCLTNLVADTYLVCLPKNAKELE